MNISVAGLIININLIFEKEFIPLKDYEINSRANFFINSSYSSFDEKLGEPYIKTTYFDKYKIGNKIIQKQKKIINILQQ